jgi:uncharacterized protein YwqG
MKLAELHERLAANGLDKYFPILQPFLRNAIRLYPQTTNESGIKIGQSRIGGCPDLPPGVSWPSDRGYQKKVKKKFFFFGKKVERREPLPLSFIAQINLAEVAPFDPENLLPKTGILYFFYSAEQDSWGFDPKDVDQFSVIYYDGDLTTLSATAFPEDLPPHARFKAGALEMRSEISLPSYTHEVYDKFSEAENDLIWENVDPVENRNQLLGHSDNIQGEMELECELVTNGLYCGDPSGYHHPKARKLAPNAKNWRLLLQIDSNDENEMMWGDAGRLYFWIRKEDLENRCFDRTWCILQCF